MEEGGERTRGKCQGDKASDGPSFLVREAAAGVVGRKQNRGMDKESGNKPGKRTQPWKAWTRRETLALCSGPAQSTL